MDQLREQRSAAWDEAKSILDRAAAQHRDLTTSEQQRFDALNTDLDESADRIREFEERQRADDEAARALSTIQGRPSMDRHLSHEIRQRVTANDRRPFELDLRGLASGVSARDLATTSGAGLPVSYANEIVRGLVTTSGILAAGARLVTTSTGEDYKVPRSTANSTAAIVAEGAAIGESDPTLDVVTLEAFKYAVLIDVTFEMLNDSTFDVAGFLAEQSGEAIGTAFGGHLAAGDGSSKPTGVATSASAGVTGAGTAPTADELIDLQHSVAAPYQRGAAWVMASATLGTVRQLKDNQNRYLFEDVRPDDPQAAGTLLGKPVYLDEGVAATDNDAKSVLYGDFSRVWVRQTQGLRFESTDAFRFGNDIVSFRAIHRLDGQLVDTTAVKAFQGAAA